MIDEAGQLKIINRFDSLRAETENSVHIPLSSNRSAHLARQGQERDSVKCRCRLPLCGDNRTAELMSHVIGGIRKRMECFALYIDVQVRVSGWLSD